MLTEKLYDKDSYQKEFEAVVISCEAEDNTEGKYKVVLDRTAFFPEGGGQTADTGMLGEQQVVDAREKDEIVYHTVLGPMEVGSKVKGVLDFEERFSKMQQHTGEHIVSGLVHDIYGYDNVGFHLGNDTVTMDFNGDLDEAGIRNIEQKANEAVVKNIPVQVTYPSKDILQDMEYRSKIEIDGQVRIVTIPGYDVCACCAPHVRTTGEIGLIKLVNVQVHRGGVRVTMVCGFRALAHYNQLAESVHQISVSLSAKEELVADAVERLKEENIVLKSKIASLSKDILRYKVKEIEEGQPRVILFEEDLEGNDVRELVNLLLKKNTGLGIVFAGNDEEGYRYVMGSKEQDCRIISKELNEVCRGRGGGKPEMVQGTLTASRKQIEEYFA